MNTLNQIVNIWKFNMSALEKKAILFVKFFVFQARNFANGHRQACAKDTFDDGDRVEKSWCSTITRLDSLYGACPR